VSNSGKTLGSTFLHTLSISLYNTAILSYGFIIHVSRYVNQKADRWVRGRQNWRQQIEASSLGHQQPIWIHAASLGEFEQARPLISAIRSTDASAPIVVTFFSPSGFEQVRKKGIADDVFYLPLDTPKNASDFVERLNPRIALFVKYEFWYHFYRALAKKSIPLFLISAIFREDQPFFRHYGHLFRELLFFTEHIFVQDEQSQKLLAGIGYERTSIAGDTRFDRVVEIAGNREELPLVEQFLHNDSTLVAGSTWPADENVLASFYHNNHEKGLNFIIAPHEVDQKHIEQLTTLFGKRAVTYTSLLHAEQVPENCDVLLIDNIGMLASLYQYGTFAYVGGGFDAGIHNILEAAVYGMPVFFGPNHQKFNEANGLLREGGGFEVKNSQAFATKLRWLLEHDTERQRASQAAYDYVHSKTGGTSVIMDYLRNKRLIPSSRGEVD